MNLNFAPIRQKFNVTELVVRKLIALEEMIYEEKATSQIINDVMDTYSVISLESD